MGFNPTDIFDESVSLLSLKGNLDNFLSTGIGSHSSPCMASCAPHARSHTGVGCCLFVLGQSRASLQINDVLHTFFILLMPTRSHGAVIIRPHNAYDRGIAIIFQEMR
jgi:hypothetical protein